jgi:hypothetical protein
MFLVEWDFVYNPRIDCWEVQSNNAWASKSGAEDYIKQINNAEKLVKENQSLKEKLENINYEVTTALEFYTIENYGSTHASIPSVHLDFEKIKSIINKT